jgi:V8-like Glu-specific endopeptidase
MTSSGRVIGSRRGRAGVGTTLVVAALAPGAVAEADVASRHLAQPPSEVREYWTPARMRAAEPAGLVLGDGGDAMRRGGASRAAVPGAAVRAAAVDSSSQNTAFPDRAHGRVFFTIQGGSAPGDYLCSGTVADSPAHTLVWTAGHCVYDSEFGGGFATNWSFVPAYRNGQRPFGTWAASDLYTTRGWRENVNIRVDLGAAAVSRDAQGRGVEDVVGGLGIGFGRPRDQSYSAFGYPAVATLFRPDFDGQRRHRCDSPRIGDDSPPGSGPDPIRIDCDMSSGSSGGSWIAGGFITSVTSYSYAGDFSHLYGPYQGGAAEDLHDEAGGPEIVCAGRPVTNLGGPGRQSYRGIDGADSFRLAGGRDRANGGAGRDRLCGGDGRDLLIGGPGRDICVGGGGRDRARGCATTRQIP